MVTPRERARERTMAEIRELAWRQVEELGASSLSLRAIARDLGVVSSAIYRYVHSRDDLVTALLVEGFSDLAETVEAAEAAVPWDDYRERWLTIARTMRAWALERPAAWGLLYGGPVPGYYAPQQETSPPGMRVLLRHGSVLMEALAAGVLSPRVGPAGGFEDIPGDLRPIVDGLATAYGVQAPAEVVVSGFLGWTSLLGLISAEVFEQFGPEATRVTSLLVDLQMQGIADGLGL